MWRSLKAASAVKTGVGQTAASSTAIVESRRPSERRRDACSRTALPVRRSQPLTVPALLTLLLHHHTAVCYIEGVIAEE